MMDPTGLVIGATTISLVLLAVKLRRWWFWLAVVVVVLALVLASVAGSVA